MFGSIKAYVDELKVREYHAYRAYYCGVCRCIGRSCGQMYRWGLSYDAAFLAVLLSAVSEEAVAYQPKRCIVRWNKAPVVIDSAAVGYAADVNALLTYHKIRDNAVDERGLHRALPWVLGRGAHKMRDRYAELYDYVDQCMAAQRVLEADGCDSVDRAAKPVSDMMSRICAYDVCDALSGDARAALSHIGAQVGRFAYIADAYNDIVEDCIKRRYNPFLVENVVNNTDDARALKASLLPRVRELLTLCAADLALCYELLYLYHDDGICRNIIYGGMRRTIEQLCADSPKPSLCKEP